MTITGTEIIPATFTEQQQQQHRQQQQQNQSPVGKPITVVKSWPRVMVHMSKFPNQHFPGATTQLSQGQAQMQQLLQQQVQHQQQQRDSYQQSYQGKLGLPAQNMNNSNKPMSSETAKLYQQLLLQEKQITENNRRLEALSNEGMPSNNVVLEGGGQFEEGKAYVVRDKHSHFRTMIWSQGEFKPYDAQPENTITPTIHRNNVVLEGGGQFEDGKVYVLRDKHNNSRTMIWSRGEFKPYTIMPTIHRNNVVLEGGGQFEEGQAYVIRDKHSHFRTMIWSRGEFKPYAAQPENTSTPTIHRNNVVLEGGGQFEEGQAYVIRDKHSHFRTMIWSQGEFKPYDAQPENTIIQHSTIDSSQRGRGSRGHSGGHGQGTTGDVTSSPGIFNEESRASAEEKEKRAKEKKEKEEKERQNKEKDEEKRKSENEKNGEEDSKKRKQEEENVNTCLGKRRKVDRERTDQDEDLIQEELAEIRGEIDNKTLMSESRNTTQIVKGKFLFEEVVIKRKYKLE